MAPYLTIQRIDKNRPYSPLLLKEWLHRERPGSWTKEPHEAAKFPLSDLPSLLDWVRPRRGHAVKLVCEGSICTLAERNWEGRKPAA